MMKKGIFGEAIGLAKDKSGILTYRDLLLGILRFIPKLPAAIRVVREANKLRSEPDTRVSLGTFLEKNAVQYPNHPAILFDDLSYSHSEFNGIVNRYAHYLLSVGVKRGEPVGVLLENRPEILFLIGAVSKIGAVASLINSNLRGAALCHSLKVAPSKHCIIGEERIEAFRDIREDLAWGDDVHLYFLRDTGACEPPEGFIDWDLATRDAAAENPSSTREIRLSDPFAYVFTSGTTGMPKAAITLHNRWVFPLLLFGRMMLRLGPGETIYVPLPFYHGTALYAAWPSAAANGAAMAIRRKFSASGFWKDIARYNAAAFVYIGELCRYLMQQPPVPLERNNTLTKMLGSGLRPDMWKEFKARFGIKEVYEFYGASESNFAFANVLNLDCTVGTCPLPFAIVKYDIAEESPVRDEQGFLQRVEVGEAGLLICQISDKAPYAGYTDSDASERKVLRDVFEKGDAWFNSGDLLRDIGFNHAQFVDRLGDTFRWKGENVSTTEVEAALNAFEQVLQSSVYGVTIPGTNGRAGMAALVADRPPADFDLTGLLSALRSALPSYAVPIFLRFSRELETTASSMKLKKVNLKSEGFDPHRISDPLYVLLPGGDGYVPLTEDIYDEIVKGTYRY